MENSIWKDATTYCRGDTKREQTAWECQTGELRIYITNAFRGYDGFWIMHCAQVGISTMEIPLPEDVDVKEVQSAAIRVVKNRLQKMIASIS